MDYGLGNEIIPFKERTFDVTQPIQVYRYLKAKGKKYSIKQNGVVVAHAKCLMLHNVDFYVNKKQQAYIREKKYRFVHAWAAGILAMKGGMGVTAKELEDKNEQLPAHISYNPYTDKGFMVKNLTTEPKLIRGARCVVFTQLGVSGTYTF